MHCSGKGGAERPAFVVARSQRVRPEVAGPMLNSATKQSNLSAKTGLLPFRQEESRGRGDALHLSPPRREVEGAKRPRVRGLTASLSEAAKRQRCRHFPNCRSVRVRSIARAVRMSRNRRGQRGRSDGACSRSRGLATAARRASARELRRRRDGVRRGHHDRTAFDFKSGAVAIVKGGTEIATVAEPGAVLGELSALLDQPHSADVRALEPSEFHVADAAALLGRIRPRFFTSP